MSPLSGSLPSIEAIGSLTAFSAPQMLPSLLLPAALPRVELPTGATPERPSLRPPFVDPATAQSEVRRQATAYAPASLPAVDWAFVAAIPRPPPAHYALPIGTPTRVAQQGRPGTLAQVFELAQPLNLDPFGPYGQARS